MFRSPLRMNAQCPGCGYRFDRGHGYFVGAMYASYSLFLLLGAGVALAAWLAFGSVATTLAVTIGILLLAGPLVIFPDSRLIWVWIEREGWLHDGDEDRERLRLTHLRRGGGELPVEPMTLAAARHSPPSANDDQPEPPRIA